jgi:hypothetical protein
MANQLFICICVSIVVFTFIAIYLLIKRYLVSQILKDKESTLNSSLSAFRESHKYDSIIKDANKGATISIAQLFEDMCFNNVCKYENDPRLPKVIQDYKDLLKGKILDPDAKNVPSEIIDGILNSDYRVYLKAQIRELDKAGKDVVWFKKELKRFSACERGDIFEANFLMHLETMGAPNELLGSMVNESRMESYSPDDWQNLVGKVKEYAKKYEMDVISDFLYNVLDKSTLLDEDKLDAYCQLINLGIDEEAASRYLSGDLSSEDLARVAEMMDQFNMTCEETLENLLSTKKSELKEKSLKESYKRRLAAH